MAEELLSTTELANELGVHVHQIHQWRVRGVAPKAIRIGKELRFRRTDIDKWLKSRESKRPGS
jgi:excisionase family DNA binding protein